MKNLTGDTKVTITIDGQSVELPLSDFSPMLTSHSLAIHEWAKNAVQKAKDSITEASLENPGVYGSPQRELENAKETVADVNRRRKLIKEIEGLWK